MSEEVKEGQDTQATSDAQGAPAAEEVKAAAKPKKINRMNDRELASKIEALEKGNNTGSKYYAHLLQRKKELGA